MNWIFWIVLVIHASLGAWMLVDKLRGKEVHVSPTFLPMMIVTLTVAYMIGGFP